jgi:hypothetical protein
MPKPMSLSSLLASATILFLSATASAQLRSGMPAPFPGVPMTPPPVDHPALGAQPGFNQPSESKAAPSPAAKKPGKKASDPAVAGPKVAGKELKKAVVAVKKSLKWYESLKEARTHSGASGKPILWVQALGEDIDGFA